VYYVALIVDVFVFICCLTKYLLGMTRYSSVLIILVSKCVFNGVVKTHVLMANS